VPNGRPLAGDQRIRSELAQRAIEMAAGRAMAYRIAWLQTKGELVAAEASASKVFGSELSQRIAYTGSRILGMYSQLSEGSKWAPLKGLFEMLYQTMPGYNLAGGSSEIQRNIVATRGLDLPRS